MSNAPADYNQMKENLLYTTTIGDIYDQEENHHLLPPPPLPWSNSTPLQTDSITSHNPHYPVPTFLYSPFAFTVINYEMSQEDSKIDVS